MSKNEPDGDSDSIEFTDSDGVRWEVREIPAPVLNDASQTTAFGDYAQGWLLFSSDALKKRLAPFPSEWRDLSPYELEKWCWRAKAERRPGGFTGQTPAYGVAQVDDAASRRSP